MQGFNKYYPPDWVPESGSLNKFHGKHALGDRARKLDKGILIVRFELPFNIWCDGCNNHIGMGVRYNAEKKKVGMYYSTPILSFRCKCHLCSNWFEIRTDPQNTRYVVTEGARQKHEDVEDPERDGQIVVEAKTDEPVDPLSALEKSVGQKKKAQSAAAHLDELESLSASRWSDPYSASVALRNSFRKEKKVRVESEGRAEKVRTNYGLGDKVSKEDLRTPRAPDVKLLEDMEWARAKKEKERLDVDAETRRKRQVAQLGWSDEERPHSRPSRSTQSDRPRQSSSSSSRHPSSSKSSAPRKIAALPSRGSSRDTAKSSTTASTAAKELASRLKLATALKADPFGANSSASTSPGQRSRATVTGLDDSIRFKRRKT